MKENKDLQPISKDELIAKLKKIEKLGWIKNTTRKTNDGAAGNKLEDLLGIPENNLPIPNAAEWELKSQRDDTNSLLTLFHMEPSPTALKVVSSYLLPNYGWTHKEAGKKYPKTEKSFRATLNSKNFTRGFTVVTNNKERKVCIEFNADKVLGKDKPWLSAIKRRRKNNNQIDMVPYWGYSDLYNKARTKLLNSFLVIYETKTEGKTKYFHYYKVYKLQD